MTDVAAPAHGRTSKAKVASALDGYRVVIDHLPVGSYLCDTGGLITYYNKAALELWGRAPKLNDPVDRWCGSFRLYASDGTPIPHDGCWMALALRERKAFQGRPIVVERPDGQRRHALAHASPLFDADGRLVGAINILLDLTHVHSTEERLAALLDSIDDHFVQYDHEWRYTFVTEKGAALIGKTRTELLGRSIWEVFPEAVGNSYDQELRRAVAEQRVVRFENYYAPLGKWFDNHIYPTGGGAIVFAADITARKNTEIALRDAERQQRALLELVPAGVFYCAAPDGTLRYFNRRAVELWGRTPDLASGVERYCGSLKLHTTDGQELPHASCPMRDVLAGASVRNGEVVMERPDGSRITVLVNAEPVRDDAGVVIGAVNVFQDISERKDREVALEGDFRRVQSFIENASEGIHWVAENGTILWANRAELEMLGYSAEEYIGRDISEFHAHREVINDILCRLKGRETLHNYEAELRCKDGSTRQVSINSSVLFDGDRFVHTCCFTRDITERKRAEEEQARVAAIVESSHDAIFSKTLDGIITSWNQAAERLLGYRAEEILARSIDLLIPSDRLVEEQGFLRRLRNGERISNYDTERLSKAGERIEVSITTSPVRDRSGRVIGASSVMHSIGERKAAERALRDSQAQLQAELDATRRLHGLSTRLLSAADLQCGLDDVLATVMASCTADFGNIQLLDASGTALEIVSHTGFPQPFLDHFRSVRIDDGSSCAQALKTRTRVIVADVELDDGYAPHRPIAALTGYRAVQSTPMLSKEGAVLGVLSTYFHAPHTPSSRDQQLLDIYARHAADLIVRVRLEEALKDADRRKDQFLATLAHELRNPLAPIRNAVAILRSKGPQEPILRWGRDVIERQAAHMTRLLDDLLDISRITNNKLNVQAEPLNLRAVIDAAVETSRPALEAAGHRFELDYPEAEIRVHGDHVRLAQVFSNLLNNAARYTPDCGEISLRVTLDGERVVTSVRDNGIGIAPTQMRTLFQMFAQATPALERSQAGLGIGLALVKGLVELHGGTVAGYSEGPGKGSEFVVRLPVTKSHSRVAAAAPATQSPAALRILVVDDIKDAADSLAIFLGVSGHETQVAYAGPDAIDIADRFHPDVVLLDLGMPGMNGFEVCRQLRHAFPQMCIVALSGWGQEADRKRTAAAGFDHHWVKPVSPAEFMTFLDQHVPSRQVELAAQEPQSP